MASSAASASRPACARGTALASANALADAWLREDTASTWTPGTVRAAATNELVIQLVPITPNRTSM